MAKKDRVDSVAAPEAVHDRAIGTDAEQRPDAAGGTAASEQLHLIPPPVQDKMVQEILDRQAIFGF